MDIKEKMNLFNQAEKLSKEIGEFIQSKPDMNFGLAMSGLALTIVKAAKDMAMPKEEILKLFGLTMECIDTQQKSEALMDRFFEAQDKKGEGIENED